MLPGRKAPPFEDRYVPEPNTGCFLWLGAVDKDGYGWITHRQRTYQAHRFSWQLHRGDIPVGMWVLHKCDQPGCVNPDHLFLGTAGDNSRDRDSKGRDGLGDQAGQNNRSAKLTEADVLAIRADTRVRWQIAQDYGVLRQTIDKIKNRQRWKHI